MFCVFFCQLCVSFVFFLIHPKYRKATIHTLLFFPNKDLSN